MELSNRDRLNRNDVIRGFKRRLSDRSEFEARHATRVAVYAVATGAELKLSDGELLSLRYGAELHDAGKLEFPSQLFLLRPADQKERELIKTHPEAGASLLSEYGWLVPSLEAIRAHHERWDGAGYPNGLSELQIPIGARIVAVAEAFDAMTMPSGWRTPIAEKEALAEVSNCAGTQFDPEIVRAFLKVQPLIQPVGL